MERVFAETWGDILEWQRSHLDWVGAREFALGQMWDKFCVCETIDFGWMETDLRLRAARIILVHGDGEQQVCGGEGSLGKED